MDDRLRFVAYTLGLWVFGVVVGTALAPPDPYTQLVAAVPSIVLGPIVAYWLVYRRERDGSPSRKT